MCIHGCRSRTASTTLTYKNYLYIGVRLIIFTPDGNIGLIISVRLILVQVWPVSEELTETSGDDHSYYNAF